MNPRPSPPGEPVCPQEARSEVIEALAPRLGAQSIVPGRCWEQSGERQRQGHTNLGLWCSASTSGPYKTGDRWHLAWRLQFANIWCSRRSLKVTQCEFGRMTNEHTLTNIVQNRTPSMGYRNTSVGHYWCKKENGVYLGFRLHPCIWMYVLNAMSNGSLTEDCTLGILFGFCIPQKRFSPLFIKYVLNTYYENWVTSSLRKKVKS